MKQYLEYFKSNWEVAVLLGVLLLGGVFWLFATPSQWEDEDNVGSGRVDLVHTGILSEDAFDFVQKKSTLALEANPFVLPLTAPAPQPKPQVVKPQPKPTPKPAAQTTVKKPVTPVPKQEVKPVPPPKKPKTFELGKMTFMFKNVNDNGEPLALVQVEKKDESVETFTFTAEQGTWGFKILSIDDKKIFVQDAKGKRGTIALNGTSKLWIQVEVSE